MSVASPDTIPKHLAQSFIEHDGGEWIDALRIVAPQATKGASLEEDICPHSGTVVY